MNMTVSDIGKAKLIDPPTVENTVDGKENLKGGVFGRLSAGKSDDEEQNSNELSTEAIQTDAATAVSTGAEDAAKAASKTARRKTHHK